MRCRSTIRLLTIAPLLLALATTRLEVSHASAANSSNFLRLEVTRKLPSDLEISGEVAAVPSGATRYVSLDTLLSLPLVTYTVKDDLNFSGSVTISGIPLENLARLLGAKPSIDLVVAICNDSYQAHYPAAYIKEHHPLLVLLVNGEPPSRWPKDPEMHRYEMGPYLISHRKFTPSFRILSHTDEAQIPWGVVRLEFHNETAFFSGIAPRGPRGGEASVRAGYEIARQNCFRCHNAGQAGGQKAGRTWSLLAASASRAPEYFSAYVRNPKGENAMAQMPGNPGYDDATIRALRDYFATFAPAAKP